MARTAAAGSWSRVHACARTVRRCLGRPSWLAAGLALIGLICPGVCRADLVKGDATFSAGGGYARLVLTFAKDVDAEVTSAGTIVVIRFNRPVDLPVDQLSDAVPDYVGSARRDPDGSAIRLSLARRVTINTMTAGERVFVDFLPNSWNGAPPGLPPEVVRELAERARVAERELRQQRALTRGEEASAHPGPRVGPADLRAFCFRSARRCRCLFGAERAETQAVVQRRAGVRSGGRQAGGAAEHRVDQSEGRRRNFRGGTHHDRRRRCPLLPRGEELRHRRRVPASRKAPRADVDVGRLARSGARPCRPRQWCRRRRPCPRSPPRWPRPRGRPARLCRRRRRRSRREAHIEINPEPAPKTSPASETPKYPRPLQRSRRRPQPRRRQKCRSPRPRRRPSPQQPPAAEIKSGDSAAGVSASAEQRRPAADLFIFGRHAGGVVPPRRYRVAGVRFQKADRCRADPQPGRRRSSPTSASCRWTRGRRSASVSTARKCPR